jgi:tetratricopeptide (TPR) repeat protein
MELVLNNDNSEKTPTLCLNMIVKNESKIITRLFNSVLPIIDCYCICDTGSTDNTTDVIEEYFKSKNIPGIVVHEPFVNFCHNRNFALNSCVGMSDYVILLDADMILDIRQFDKNMLKMYDSCTILQGNDNFYYHNLRIVKNNGLYSYAGVTHEYINTPQNNRNYDIKKNELFINDIGDGGAKNDKFTRDIALLLKGIEDEPNNERYHFYLANTYCDSGQLDKAIEMYEKRIKLGGWFQEVWYSYYRIGICYKNKGDIGNAIHYWLLSYDNFPERLEGLYEILHYYRNTSKHKLADKIYKMAAESLNKNINRDGYLFLQNDVYTYKLLFEYTILAAYVGIKNINNEAVQIFNNSSDDGYIRNLLCNMKFYKDILTPIKCLNFDSSRNISINNVDTQFYSSSSCMIKNNSGDGYLMNIRYVNYYINEKGNYLNCEKHIATANKFVELSSDLEIVQEKWFKLEYLEKTYLGVEDVRIFNDVETNELLFIGTGFHNNNTIGIVEGKYNTNEKTLVANEIKPVVDNSPCEKNWVYVDYNNATHIIYKWYPLEICKLNDDRKRISMVEHREMPRIFSHVRGSTCGFKYNKKIGVNNNGNISIDIYESEIWFVTHVVSYEQPRHYYHVIAVFDEKLNLLRYSAPFKFSDTCIEYCLGIVVEDERVMINYSTWDRTTRVGIYDKKYIDSIVKY